MIDPAISALLAYALAAIFVWSGATKLDDLEMFVGAVANYRLIPRALEQAFARVLPVAECTCAAALLFASTRARAAVALLFLLCVFTGAIAINLARGRTNIDCGCFGPALRQGLSGWLLARNAALMLLAVCVAAPAATRPIGWMDGVTIGMGATTLVCLYASVNYVLGNVPHTRTLEAL